MLNSSVLHSNSVDWFRLSNILLWEEEYIMYPTREGKSMQVKWFLNLDSLQQSYIMSGKICASVALLFLIIFFLHGLKKIKGSIAV